MWPFRAKQSSDDQGQTLAGRVADLERSFRALEREWLDVLEQNKRIMGRIVKRGERADARDDAQSNLPTLGRLRAAGQDPFHRR